MSSATGYHPTPVGQPDRQNADPAIAELSDQELTQLVRSGDNEAFAELFNRHRAAATRLAFMHANDTYTAQDFVAEAFVRVLQALKSGGGPSSSFRSYLLRVLRNLVTEAARSTDRQVSVPDVSIYEEEYATPAGNEALKNYEHGLAREALASLSDRWRTILWYTIVHSQQPAAIAAEMGISPNSVAALSYRAKEGLRQAYLAVHLNGKSNSVHCSYYASRLAAYSRGRLGKCGSEEMMSHLRDCDICAVLYQEISELNQLLPA
ncbi:sigma-70 family RNA polymerase sigma factor [Streptomyces sp. AK02-04a]|uniref:RNA polymerase sigma factor n=1 Tax=Streptomyces sp. AK02-04a TaxID=3028649 RepID=UPI0029A80835|nr:sigma-70 family RNA polymerase sigma factor [Streptomyces sp. AK02-04a]MDX3763406.1 sigma-70 family RNA polymerase sigma factor [Streptomyces sp. AK02-04a]